MNTEDKHMIDDLTKRPVELPSNDYFDQLKAELLAQAQVPKVIPFYRKGWVMLSAAASVAVIVSLFFMQKQTTTETVPDWDTVSKEEVLAYIEDNIEDFEAESIGDQLAVVPEWETGTVVSEKAVGHSTHPGQSYHELLNEVNNNEILEYLKEDVIDIDDELLISN